MRDCEVYQPLPAPVLAGINDIKGFYDFYYAQVASAIRAAEAHIRTEDWEALRRSAHRLAGTSAVLGAMILHRAFRQLEVAARSCDHKAATEITSQIPALLDRAQQVIRASLGSAA